MISPCNPSHLGCLCVLCAWSATDAAGDAGTPSPAAYDFHSQIEPLLENLCFDCHGDEMDKGGLLLDTYKTDPAFLNDTTSWLAVWRKLDSQLMPPPDKDQPTAAERQLLQDWILWRVFQLDPEHPDPGHVTLRRLNRTAYENTIRDWLGVDFAASENFPSDDTGYGFDNIGDVLSISPLLMEKYLDAAQDITAELLKKTQPQIPVLTIGGDRFREGPESKRTARQLALAQAATVHHTHDVVHTGRYRVTVEFRITGSEDASAETARLHLGLNQQPLQDQFLGWDNRRNLTLTVETELQRGTQDFQLQLVPGNPPQPGENHLTLNVNQVRLQGPLDGSQLDYPREYRRLFPDGPPPAGEAARRAYAAKILQPLADRAFRRPVDPETLDRLVALTMSVDHQEGVTFERAIGQALTALLASPRFLFLVEPSPPSGAGSKATLVDEFSLASRLSYFLWNSLPDDELFTLARTNGLRAHLPAQIDRLLTDPRAHRFVESFVGQWLQTRDVETVAPNARRILGLKNDREVSERFNDRTRHAMKQETELVFADLLRHNGSLTDLLLSRNTYLNEALAKFYGVPGVSGAEMRKVTLPEESPRGGLLTHGSVLLVTSNPTRTSPVKRGQFILENLLGSPAPPPPPNVPELEQAKREAKKALSMRELIAIHRENPLCASCHERLDPPGLAFEHFNALGEYRELENGQPIDTAGALVTGETFQGPADLAVVLTTSRRHDLYRCTTEKLLTYALGRGLEYYDLPTLNDIVIQLEQDNGRLRTLVDAVIESAPFQRQRAALPAPGTRESSPQPTRKGTRRP